MNLRAGFLAAGLAVSGWQAAVAQQSIGCDALVRAAQAGLEDRLRLDDEQIQPPMSVRSLTCMTAFFNGTLFDVIEDWEGALIGMLTDLVINAVCSLAREAWDATIGQFQCGIVIQAFTLGFGGSLRGGNFCGTITIGGDGPAIFGASLMGGADHTPYIGVSPVPPTGYQLFLPDEAIY
jgi:hypothetical protein